MHTPYAGPRISLKVKLSKPEVQIDTNSTLLCYDKDFLGKKKNIHRNFVKGCDNQIIFVPLWQHIEI